MKLILLACSLLLYSSANAQSGSKIAVMDLKALKGIDLMISLSLTGMVCSRVAELGEFKEVITGEDIKSMLEHIQLQQAIDPNCTDTKCLAHIGGALGVDLLLSGDIGLVGDIYLINLKLIDIESIKVIKRKNRQYQGDESGLIKAVDEVVRDIFARSRVVQLSSEAEKGYFYITSNPSGAKVYVDGMDKGVTPIELKDLEAKPYDILISLEGYGDKFFNKIQPKADTRVFIDAQLHEQKGSLVVKTVPENARIYLDGVFINESGSKDLVLKDIRSGSHTLTVLKNDYTDWKADIEVETKKSTFQLVQLNKLPGFISAKSSPAGAKVYLDGIYRGITPCRIDSVDAGQHSLRLSASGYEDLNKAIIVTANRVLDESADMVRLKQGGLAISTEPESAKVYLDDVYKGISPVRIRDVAVGTHSVRLTMAGYQDLAKEVTVELDKIIEEKLTLVQPAPEKQAKTIQYDKAQKMYEKGIKYEEKEDYSKAAVQFQKVFKEFPDWERAAEALFKAAEDFTNNKNYEQGAALYEQVAKLFPDHTLAADALYNAGSGYEKVEKWAEAARVFALYVSKFPETREAPDLLFSAARYYARIGDTGNAGEYYRLFSKQYPHDLRTITVHYAMGKMHYTKTDYDEARAEFYDCIATFDGRGKPESEKIYAAESQFLLAEMDRADYEKATLEGPGATFDERLARKVALLKDLNEKYAKVVQYGIINWTPVSMYRIGSDFESFAEAFVKQNVPPGKSADDKMANEKQIKLSYILYLEKALDPYLSLVNLEPQARGIKSDTLITNWIIKAKKRLLSLDYKIAHISYDIKIEENRIKLHGLEDKPQNVIKNIKIYRLAAENIEKTADRYTDLFNRVKQLNILNDEGLGKDNDVLEIVKKAKAENAVVIYEVGKLYAHGALAFNAIPEPEQIKNLPIQNIEYKKQVAQTSIKLIQPAIEYLRKNLVVINHGWAAGPMADSIKTSLLEWMMLGGQDFFNLSLASLTNYETYQGLYCELYETGQKKNGLDAYTVESLIGQFADYGKLFAKVGVQMVWNMLAMAKENNMEAKYWQASAEYALETVYKIGARHEEIAAANRKLAENYEKAAADNVGKGVEMEKKKAVSEDLMYVFRDNAGYMQTGSLGAYTEGKKLVEAYSLSNDWKMKIDERIKALTPE